MIIAIGLFGHKCSADRVDATNGNSNNFSPQTFQLIHQIGLSDRNNLNGKVIDFGNFLNFAMNCMMDFTDDIVNA